MTVKELCGKLNNVADLKKEKEKIIVNCRNRVVELKGLLREAEKALEKAERLYWIFYKY